MTALKESPASPAKMVDAQGVAKMCNCSARHVRRLVDAELMPAPVKLGHLVRWPLSVVEEWIDAGCPPCSRREVHIRDLIARLDWPTDIKREVLAELSRVSQDSSS